MHGVTKDRHECKDEKSWIWICKTKCLASTWQNWRGLLDFGCGVIFGHFFSVEPVWLLAGWPDPPCGRIINPRATTISGSRQHNSSIEPQRRRLLCFDMRSHRGKFWSEKQPNTSTERWWWPFILWNVQIFYWLIKRGMSVMMSLMMNMGVLVINFAGVSPLVIEAK